jgi:hypothetical protein
MFYGQSVVKTQVAEHALDEHIVHDINPYTVITTRPILGGQLANRCTWKKLWRRITRKEE